MRKVLINRIKAPFRPTYYEILARKARPFKNRKLDFYILSTGRCGTRFLAEALNLSSNSIVHHEPNPSAYEDSFKLVNAYNESVDSFLNYDHWSLSMLKRKLAVNAAQKSIVYGETANTNFPFGLLFNKLIDNEVKLIHLIRNPIDCCRSIIKVENSRYGSNFAPRAKSLVGSGSDIDKAISVYKGINDIIRYQFQKIGSSKQCLVVKLEDLGPEKIGELYDFLDLEGYNKAKVESLINDKSDKVRHSHMARLANSETPDLSDSEIQYIDENTREYFRSYA